MISGLINIHFRDSIVDSLYDKILETLECQSHCAAFPEMALPAVLQLKTFIKKCPLANYNKKMKQLLEKIQETTKFVEKQRGQVHFDLADTKAVLALENQLRQNGTPLSTYYASWKKIKDREMAVKIARTPQVSYCFITYASSFLDILQTPFVIFRMISWQFLELFPSKSF